jgi:hydroxymethylglutaryl-CoA lyase
MFNQEITIVECPRDAIQGIENFIPTEKKISYYTNNEIFV